MSEFEDETDECGYTYDHDEVVDHEDDDGIQWHCARCGAEGWMDPEPTTPAATPDEATR